MDEKPRTLFDEMEELANRLSYMYLDYACCMDYLRILSPDNIAKSTAEAVEECESNFKHLLPEQSLEDIKKEMALICVNMIEIASYLAIRKSHDFREMLKFQEHFIHQIESFEIISYPEYQNVYMNLHNWFTPNYLNNAYNKEKNDQFISHLINVCQKLGFNLKEHLLSEEKCLN